MLCFVVVCVVATVSVHAIGSYDDMAIAVDTGIVVVL